MDMKAFEERLRRTSGNPEGYRRMLAGEAVEMPDAYILEKQAEGAVALAEYNAIPAGEMEIRRACLERSLGRMGRSIVQQPIFWEYGRHVEIGDGCFVNVGCKFLDSARIVIGDLCAIGPGVMFLAAGHPVSSEERDLVNENGQRTGVINICKPITVEERVWIGGGAIILGGVTIGRGTTIGAGAVVTKSLPPGVLAAGNPARIIREI